MQPNPEQQRKLVAQLHVFKDRLLDINSRNPSLFLKREVKTRSFDIAKLGDGVGESCYGRLVRGTSGVLLVADLDDSREAIINRAHLQQITRAANEREVETGLKELYLGICWMTGYLDPQTYARGPLLLVPARLELVRAKRAAGWQLHLDPEEIAVNEAIAAAIRKHRGARFFDGFAEKVAGELETLQAKGVPPPQVATALFDRVGRELADVELRLAYAGCSKLEALVPLTTKTMPEKTQPLSLVNHMVLGLFPQSSTALYADLETLVERVEAGETDIGIVDNLLEAPADPENEIQPEAVDLESLSEGSVHTVVPCDPSQLAVLRMAQTAECMVVRGPPGTGKSQLIVNLVSDAMAHGKRVLVVCQKRAALDVVHRRLDEVGLGAAAALVHDATADRGDLYKKLSALLESAASSSPLAPESSAKLAAEFDRDASSLRALVGPLGKSVHGLPIHELYARAETRVTPVLDLAPEILQAEFTELQNLCSTIEQVKPGRLRFDVEHYPLARRQSWASLGHVDAARLQQAFGDLARRLAERSWLPNFPDSIVPTALESQITAYLSLRTRWYRWLLPRWWRAKNAIERAAACFGDVSVELWQEALLHYGAAAELVRAIGAHMQTSWVAAMLGRLPEPQLLASGADHARRALASDAHDIRAYDGFVGALVGGARSVLDQCATKLDPNVDWGRHLRQEVLLRWIDEAESAYPQLRNRVAQAYEETRRRLELSTKQRREAVAKELASKLRAVATTPTLNPRESAHPNRKGATDWNKLAHELGKKRRVKPLRALLGEFSWPMKQVVRCWLASPEVVAEVFPLERSHFDLVIFDEASQLTVERALPVVYRGAQVVIAGDEQQMPPSSFFSSTLDDEEDVPPEGDQELGEARLAVSFLAQAKRIYGFHYLAWHYRSLYPELIEFSNHAFYDGMLQVAANLECGSAQTPIQWIAVRGMWTDQTNPAEVSRAVDELHRLLTERPRESVGIITFNQKQQNAIYDEIDRRRSVDPEFDATYARAENPDSVSVDDKPFVKNIENVQGDERDHIIFSVGYAPGPDGVLRRNFGPLGLSGGENRLNVAITRARRSVRVICSFDPDTLATEAAKNSGPRLLKQYLQYARAVSTNDVVGAQAVLSELNPEHRVPESISGAPRFDSPLEEQVYNALRQRGLKVYTQWGAGGYHIDLVVVHPNDPTRLCLGIECDGARYHSGRSVRERDLSRQAFLESRGWRIHRIWSRDWWQAPERELQVVMDLVAQAKGGASVATVRNA